jgi:hypothetical protein
VELSCFNPTGFYNGTMQTKTSETRKNVRYKDRSLRPVRLQQFLEDGQVYWSAEDDERGHLTSGWSTRAEVVEIVDQSTTLRFCDFTVIIHKLHREYRVPFHVGSVQAIREGFCVGGCSTKGVAAYRRG